MQHHKAACAVGILGLMLQALLAQHGCMLVSQTACSHPAPGLRQVHRSGRRSSQALRHSAQADSVHVVVGPERHPGNRHANLQRRVLSACYVRVQGLSTSTGKQAGQNLLLLLTFL